MPVASNVALTSFTDTSVSNGTKYFYRVAAVNAVGTSVLVYEVRQTGEQADGTPVDNSVLVNARTGEVVRAHPAHPLRAQPQGVLGQQRHHPARAP